MVVDITGFNRMRREQERRTIQEQATVQEETPALEEMTYNGLKAAAKEAGIKGYGKMNKEQLIEALKAGE